MRLARYALLALAALVLCLASPRTAKADSSSAHSVAVVVLGIDSDDSEEQADAMTGAIRSRIRASQGWSLVETNQSLGMLTAALRCPAKPTPDCEQRIGEQLKAERFIFGYVTKGPQASQVTAEIHLYQKGKADTVVKESYADNLKDQNDDSLRKIAQKILDKLGGNAVGVLIVHFATETGEVIIDGEKHVPLEKGTARVELSPGSHSVEVAATGQPAQKRTALVTAGKETSVELAVAKPAEPAAAAAAEEKPFPLKKVIGAAAMVVGVGFGVLAVERFLKYESLQRDLKNDPAYGPGNFLKTNGEVDACDAKLIDGTQSQNACQKSKDAKTVSTVGIVAAGVSGVFLLGGAYLFFFADRGNVSAKTTRGKARLPTITPALGLGSGSLLVSGSF
jgi:hypothetical protein